ncbi:MAG: type II pantothenate kinase [Oscillospiraceae bacterium]|jgi:type II pantothenate kinase|nr:type II pantothenate kinase [Oscillospiraceae bacterium]
MGITLGIDIGGSTTKIVGIDGGSIITPLLVRASDPVASLFGAFGKFVDENSLSLSNIENVAITGVGASHVEKSIYGIPTTRMEEFLCNGYGGLCLSGLDEAVIVSMGTGTALVNACKDDIRHIGGTGMGGGTLLGLSSLILNVRDIDYLIEMAAGGDLRLVDLTVGDISKEVLPGLPSNSTASNFGKISDEAGKNDLALAIFNLVFQTIGMMAVFATRGTDRNDVVLIGNLTAIPQCREIFMSLEQLYNYHFIIPLHSEHATAVGAALALLKNRQGVKLP